MKYKAVLFDLDGTVFDTIQELAIAMNEARRLSGLELQPLEQVRAMVGNGIRNLIKRSLASDEGADSDRVFNDFMEFYNEHCCENTYIYSGMEDVLNELRRRGVKLAIVSNKADYASCKIVNALLPGVFDYVRGHREDTPLKPSPEVIYETLDILGVTVSEAVYVGDSEVDIRTAANSGMECISVDWGFKTHEFLVEHGASCIVSDSASLLGKLTVE